MTPGQQARVEALFDADMDPELPGHTFGHHLTANTIYRAVTILDAPLRELIDEMDPPPAFDPGGGVQRATRASAIRKKWADKLRLLVLPEDGE